MKLTSDIITRRVGLRIRRIRLEHKVNQTELSRRTGIPRDQLSRIERGHRRIAVDELVLIAVALDRLSGDFFVDVFQGF